MDLLQRTCNYERMNVQRIFARGFVILGGLFWVAMVFGARLMAPESVRPGAAFVPLAIAVVVFILGLFYERLTAILLFVGAALAAIYYWVMSAGQLDALWYWMAVVVAPMLVSAILFLLAANNQRICELEESTKSTPAATDVPSDNA